MDILKLAMDRILGVGLLLILASWLSGLLGAIVAYVWQQPALQPKSPLGFLRFCLPREIFTSPSVRLDLRFAVVNRIVESILIAPILVSSAAVAAGTYALLTVSLGDRPGTPPPLWAWALIVVALVMLQDFVTFTTHFLQHKIAALWEIHKVHHSPDFLIPISNRRHHPLQFLFESTAALAASGLFLGSVCYAFALPLLDGAVLGIDAYFLANVLSFYHLRHSHIALSYGAGERWLLSPAQHQLHHSFEQRDWDRNFGLLLSCWDRWFGTILYTDRAYSFRIGLEPQYRADYKTVTRLLLVPPRNILRMGWQRLGRALPGGAIQKPRQEPELPG